MTQLDKLRKEHFVFSKGDLLNLSFKVCFISNFLIKQEGNIKFEMFTWEKLRTRRMVIQNLKSFQVSVGKKRGGNCFKKFPKIPKIH